jgi:hypothetical protein
MGSSADTVSLSNTASVTRVPGDTFSNSNHSLNSGLTERQTVCVLLILGEAVGEGEEWGLGTRGVWFCRRRAVHAPAPPAGARTASALPRRRAPLTCTAAARRRASPRRPRRRGRSCRTRRPASVRRVRGRGRLPSGLAGGAASGARRRRRRRAAAVSFAAPLPLRPLEPPPQSGPARCQCRGRLRGGRACGGWGRGPARCLGRGRRAAAAHPPRRPALAPLPRRTVVAIARVFRRRRHGRRAAGRRLRHRAAPRARLASARVRAARAAKRTSPLAPGGRLARSLGVARAHTPRHGAEGGSGGAGRSGGCAEWGFWGECGCDWSHGQISTPIEPLSLPRSAPLFPDANPPSQRAARQLLRPIVTQLAIAQVRCKRARAPSGGLGAGRAARCGAPAICDAPGARHARRSRPGCPMRRRSGGRGRCGWWRRARGGARRARRCAAPGAALEAPLSAAAAPPRRPPRRPSAAAMSSGGKAPPAGAPRRPHASSGGGAPAPPPQLHASPPPPPLGPPLKPVSSTGLGRIPSMSGGASSTPRSVVLLLAGCLLGMTLVLPLTLMPHHSVHKLHFVGLPGHEGTPGGGAPAHAVAGETRVRVGCAGLERGRGPRSWAAVASAMCAPTSSTCARPAGAPIAALSPRPPRSAGSRRRRRRPRVARALRTHGRVGRRCGRVRQGGACGAAAGAGRPEKVCDRAGAPGHAGAAQEGVRGAREGE